MGIRRVVFILITLSIIFLFGYFVHTFKAVNNYEKNQSIYEEAYMFNEEI